MLQLEIKADNHKYQHQPLLPGLPDDIAMECMVRVPHEFHSIIKSVSHAWLNLLSHPSFHQLRLQSRTCEHFLCLVQPLPPHDSSHHTPAIPAPATVTNKHHNHRHDDQPPHAMHHSPPQFALTICNLHHNTWRRTRPQGGMPMFCQCVSLPSRRKILLLGGWDPTTLQPVSDVYVLDLNGSCTWRRGASMSMSRSFFACSVVGPSTVYVAGGHDGHKNALRSAEVYDVDEDEWRKLPDMTVERDECQGLAWDGDSRFWVVSGYGTDSQGRFRSDAEFFDPSTGCWSKVDEIWPFSSISPRSATATVSIDRNRYQWWWFLGGEPQRTGGQYESMRLEIVSSIPVPDCVSRSSNPFVISLGNVDNKHHHRVFVMSGRRRTSPTLICCECEGAFIVDIDCNNGSTKWNHIHTPAGFSGFPFSACHLTV